MEKRKDLLTVHPARNGRSDLSQRVLAMPLRKKDATDKEIATAGRQAYLEATTLRCCGAPYILLSEIEQGYCQPSE